MSTQCRKCGVDLHPGLCGACERDELRAEVERFRNAVREKERLELEALQELDEALAEVKRLTKALDVCSSVHAHNVKLHEEQERLREALRDVAERQRKACAAAINDPFYSHLKRETAIERVRATPLVTEGEPVSRVSRVDRETGTITFDDGPVIETRPRRRRK